MHEEKSEAMSEVAMDMVVGQIFNNQNMKQESINKAIAWRLKHSAHVARLESFGDSEHPPSREDENHPELWKPASWRWLRKNH